MVISVQISAPGQPRWWLDDYVVRLENPYHDLELIKPIMAEAVAAIGLVASILQLASFASSVVGRINEFRNSVKELPSAFRDVSIVIPLLVSDLKKTKEAAEADKFAIQFVVEGCSAQIKVSCFIHLRYHLFQRVRLGTERDIAQGARGERRLCMDDRQEGSSKLSRRGQSSCSLKQIARLYCHPDPSCRRQHVSTRPAGEADNPAGLYGSIHARLGQLHWAGKTH